MDCRTRSRTWCTCHRELQTPGGEGAVTVVLRVIEAAATTVWGRSHRNVPQTLLSSQVLRSKPESVALRPNKVPIHRAYVCHGEGRGIVRARNLCCRDTH